MAAINCQLKLDIQPRYSFDCRHECASNVRFLSTGRIVYQAGRHFVVNPTDADAFQGGEHVTQTMGFMMRRLGQPPAYEETYMQTSEGIKQESEQSASPSSKGVSSPTAPAPGTDFSYLANSHWNSQTLVRLNAHERDHLSRDETQLVSCFAVHPNKKMLAFAEYSTEMRLVTITIADIHAASEEEFTQMDIGRFRLNFLLLPCVQQLTSDRGRREARDRRERHSRRRRLLRRVAQLKAAKLRLEEKRNEELTRAAAARRSHPNSGAASIDTTSELQSVQEDLEAAEESLQEAHHDSDSDLEGYKSDELISEEEEDQSQDEDDDDDDDDDESRDSFRPAPPARKPTFVEPVAEDESTPRTRSSRLHHRQPTQSWSRRLAGVKSIYDVTPGMKYSDDYSSADAAAGPPPPFISDHSKEELLFSRIIAIEWSRCGKYVALIGDGPKYPLGVWEISQKEMIGAQRYIGMSAQRVEFRPVHGQLGVVTLGATLLRVWDIKTKFLEHQHTFTSPVKLNEKESFIDFTYLHQMRNTMVVLTSVQFHILHDEQIVSSLPFTSSSFLSVPRCVSPTAKGFGIGLDGLLLLYEFQSSQTLFVGSAGFTDADGSDLRKYETRLEWEKHERALLAVNDEAGKQQERRREEDGIFQTSLFERFHHIQNNRPTTTPNIDVATTTDIPLPPTREKTRETFEVFLAKSIPLFRPVPGCTPPTGANATTAIAAQSAKPTPSKGASPLKEAAPAPTGSSLNVAPGSEILRVHSMAPSPDQQSLVITSRSREIVHIKLPDVGVCHTGEESSCVLPLTSGLHHGPVSSMSACSEQPLIVSCSTAENTVRIHNYLNRECEITKTFEFPPLCVSFHPLGHEIAVGFHIGLLTFRLFPGELLMRGEMAVPNISLCRYSHGGQYLAAVSGRTIMVYATNTCKTAAKFVGHGDAIMDIRWSSDDSSLFSVGLSGHMYEWSMHTHSRVREYVSYDSAFVDIAVSGSGEIAIAGVSMHADNTFCIHHHIPSSPYQFTGGFHYTHYLPPDESSQHALGVGVGINSQQKGLGLYTAPSGKSRQLIDPAFSAAYAYARRPVQEPLAASSPVGVPEEFTTVQVRANDALPVFSSYSRVLLAREQSHAQVALAAANAPSRFKSAHSSAAAALAAAAAIKASRAASGSDPLLDAYRSEAFPQTMPSVFRTIRPPHAKLAWVQMGRIWFLLAGTHRGSIEIWRTPIESFPEPMMECALHTEPITSIEVCQKLGCIITTSMDGSIFVSSLSLIPFTFFSAHPPKWAERFPVYSCAISSFFKCNLYEHLAPADFQQLYSDQKNALRVEQATLEKYRRNQVEKRLYGTYRNAENEEFLVSHASVMVRKQAYVDMESSLRASRHLKTEFANEWELKLLKDEWHMKKVLDGAEEEYKQNLAVHRDEKKRLQLRDVDRERDRNKQLDAAERAHTTGVTMLERLYERKLALESAKSEKQRKEFQQLNMKLSVELERTRQTFAKEMSEIRTLYESEKESHTFDSASLGAKLKTVEAEALVLLEEQDLDHDQDMVHDKKDISNRISSLNSSLSTARDDSRRLQVELEMLKMKNRSLGEQVLEWRARHAKEVDVVKAGEAKLKAERLSRQQVELDLSTREVQSKQLESTISKLDGQRLALREQVAALMQQLDRNDIPRAKMELEQVVRELDGEFEEKATQIKAFKKEISDKNNRISVLTKKHTHLEARLHESQQLLDRLREDIVRYKDIRQLKDKYAEFTMSTGGPSTFRRRIDHEFSRQLHFYSHTTAALQEKLTAAEAQLEKCNERRISENINLMRQQNDLRHRNKDYQDEVRTAKSDLNALKLKERMRQESAVEQASRAARDPLHTPRHHQSAQSGMHLSRILARYVDPDQRKYRSPVGTVAVDKDLLSAGEASAAHNENVRREYERHLAEKRAAEMPMQDSDDPVQRAVMQEQIDLMRQMKEESDRMLVNSYRRISEQEEEIRLLREGSQQSYEPPAPSLLPTGTAGDSSAYSHSPSSSQTPSSLSSPSHSAASIDALLSDVARKREATAHPTPMSSPRPPLSARFASPTPSAFPPQSPRPHVSGSVTARASHSVTPRSGVPHVAPPKRWQQANGTAAGAATAITPRATAIIAQAKQRGGGSAGRPQRPTVSGGATAVSEFPQFDTAGLFQAAVATQQPTRTT